MRNIHFTDYLEKQIADAFDAAGIEYVHESEQKEQELDFYLPLYETYIEVKQFHAERIGRQMASKNNVIAVQGIKAIKLLCIILLKSSRIAT